MDGRQITRSALIPGDRGRNAECLEIQPRRWINRNLFGAIIHNNEFNLIQHFRRHGFPMRNLAQNEFWLVIKVGNDGKRWNRLRR